MTKEKGGEGGGGHYTTISAICLQGTCKVITSIPVENDIKEQAKDVMDRLRMHGFSEIQRVDLEVNSIERKLLVHSYREIGKVCCHINISQLDYSLK